MNGRMKESMNRSTTLIDTIGERSSFGTEAEAAIKQGPDKALASTHGTIHIANVLCCDPQTIIDCLRSRRGKISIQAGNASGILRVNIFGVVDLINSVFLFRRRNPGVIIDDVGGCVVVVVVVVVFICICQPLQCISSIIDTRELVSSSSMSVDIAW